MSLCPQECSYSEMSLCPYVPRNVRTVRCLYVPMSPGLLLLGDIRTSQCTNNFQGTLGTYGHLSVRTASRGYWGHRDISLYKQLPEEDRGHTDISVYEQLPGDIQTSHCTNGFQRNIGDIRTSQCTNSFRGTCRHLSV